LACLPRYFHCWTFCCHNSDHLFCTSIHLQTFCSHTSLCSHPIHLCLEQGNF
jgi:hypothetical protein